MTAADASDARASFAGQGSQISLAAYGAYDSAQRPAGRRGSSAPSRPGPTSSRPDRSGCRRTRRARCRTTFAGDSRYAYVQGTSMATPMVVGHRRADPPPEPRPHGAGDRAAASRRPRAAPPARVDRRPGLGDPRRRGRADPRREHRPPRADVAGQAPAGAHAQAARSPCAGRRPTRRRRACAPRASRASSSGARPTAGASSGCSRRPRTSRAGDAAPRAGATASTRVAIDHAGNREPAPKQADARIQRRR